MVVDWEKMPDKMKVPEVRPYYEKLREKGLSLFLKRVFDIICSLFLLVLLWPLMLVLYILIKVDSKGPGFYLQSRVTKNNEEFKIVKFRTMIPNAEKIGTQVTVSNDPRVTKIGHFLRKFRLDELPQLFNILVGDMTFVGTRPEVRKYVDAYTPEMLATLLLPAGVTSLASITFKDEQELLDMSSNVDKTYIEDILPAKMNYNLSYLINYNFHQDMKIIIKTIRSVFGRGVDQYL